MTFWPRVSCSSGVGVWPLVKGGGILMIYIGSKSLFESLSVH